MKYSLFSMLYHEACSYNDPDMYVAERGWQEWMDDYADGEIAHILFRIYDLAHMGAKELRAELGLTQKTMYELYGIPKRTQNRWEHDKHQAPPGFIPLIAYTVFMEKS